jgi:hypothetical protein
MSYGYISCEREGDDNFVAMLPGDRQRLLDLAELYGWDDLQTGREFSSVRPRTEDDDAYVGTVTAEQALRLVEALERALPDIPDHDARLHKLRKPAWAGVDDAALEEDPQQPLTLLEWFSGDEKEYVRQMIAFCRGGAFRVVFEPW